MRDYNVTLPPGWLRKQIAECIKMLESLPPNVREALSHPIKSKNS